MSALVQSRPRASSSTAVSLRSRQRGAAQLFITLVLLAVIMMLGVTATIISSTQFRLAGNLQFESQAFDNAESAAAAAFSWLTTGCNAYTFNPSANTALIAKPATMAAQQDPFKIDWDKGQTVGDTSKKYVIQNMGDRDNGASSDTVEVRGTANGTDVARQPGRLFRITARGSSARGTQRLIQTNVFVVKLQAC